MITEIFVGGKSQVNVIASIGGCGSAFQIPSHISDEEYNQQNHDLSIPAGVAWPR